VESIGETRAVIKQSRGRIDYPRAIRDQTEGTRTKEGVGEKGQSDWRRHGKGIDG